jgi:hypothetical protein
MFKLFLLSLAFISVAFHANSQQAWVSGYVRDSITHFPVAKGTITNSSTRSKVQTDANGLFRIRLAPNDLIYVKAPSYHYDTLRYSILFGDSLTIYLSPSGNILPGVTVQSQYNKYQLDSIERKTAFEQMQGRTLNAIASNRTSGFGLTLNLDRFTKKKYRNKKKEEKRFQQTEEWAYVNYRFSPQLVAYYTRLQGDALRDFIYRYTPKYTWLRAHPSNDDIVNYINEKLKTYRASHK